MFAELPNICRLDPWVESVFDILCGLFLFLLRAVRHLSSQFDFKAPNAINTHTMPVDSNLGKLEILQIEILNQKRHTVINGFSIRN